MGGIIWLASFPKSGNTWVRAFLHNLFVNQEKPADINDLGRFARLDPDDLAYESIAGRPLKGMSSEEVAALRPRVHQALASISQDSVFVKTHNYLGEESGIPLVSMEHTVGAIYVIRNPLDVVISMRRHYDYTIEQAIYALNDPDFHSASPQHTIISAHSSWSNHVRSWTQNPNPALHIMRYEDMLDAPIKTFGTLAKFLGLEPQRSRLKKAIRFSSFRTLRRQEATRGFAERSPMSERFFAVGKAAQWKDQLTSGQVEEIVNAHQDQMEKFGYVP